GAHARSTGRAPHRSPPDESRRAHQGAGEGAGPRGSARHAVAAVAGRAKGSAARTRPARARRAGVHARETRTEEWRDMKWLLIGAAVLAVIVVIVLIVGLATPKDHVASV